MAYSRTETSDLDIVLIVEREDAPFRASYRYDDWPIEAFVHTPESLTRFIREDVKRGRPSLAMMCAEGVVLRDEDGVATRMKAENRALIDRGPEALTAEQIEDRRYALTDLLDDFIGCTRLDEGLFIAHELAAQAASLTLLMQGRWLGSGKWVPRALARHSPHLAERVSVALTAYYRHEDKGPLVQLAEDVLKEAGGRLFEGYYRRPQR